MYHSKMLFNGKRDNLADLDEYVLLSSFDLNKSCLNKDLKYKAQASRCYRRHL